MDEKEAAKAKLLIATLQKYGYDLEDPSRTSSTTSTNSSSDSSSTEWSPDDDVEPAGARRFSVTSSAGILALRDRKNQQSALHIAAKKGHFDRHDPQEAAGEAHYLHDGGLASGSFGHCAWQLQDLPQPKSLLDPLKDCALCGRAVCKNCSQKASEIRKSTSDGSYATLKDKDEGRFCAVCCTVKILKSKKHNERENFNKKLMGCGMK
ncbi:hypothetical protein AM588_10010405 [Phytophthora nicotianae]|uniref:FYVE-type domain-containing protein n=1 Tax=Phytophthora nicotianae TaxID=4792 RepID=A0A0W8D275_PHYNI|nr:hypothetical protein AM588_10010405 [Phytophthora nicotianae]